MRRRTILRRRHVTQAAFGALALGAPASAAFADAPRTPTADASSPSGLEAHVNKHRIGFGRSVVVTGRTLASEAGQAATLEFASTGSDAWQSIASSRIGPGGAFRLSAPLQSSGQVMVTTQSGPVAFTASAASATASAPQRVTVAAGIRIHPRSRELMGAGTIAVHGQLLPSGSGRRVLLQAERGGRWTTLSVTRTGPQGRFGFRYQAGLPGRQALRVHFAGDRSNAAVSVSAGRVIVLRQSVASWYDDAGTTGCGFHAYYGVASLSLPCGTKVTFSYGGRTVTATVDDRGPYVGGREWDLNQNTASALGFAGVGAVWASA